MTDLLTASIEQVVAALGQVREAEFGLERANARLVEYAKPVLEFGIAVAKVGHPEHQHVGGSPYWIMGSKTSVKAFGAPAGMSSHVPVFWTWASAILPIAEGLGQPLYAAFWEKERAIRLLCEAQEAFAASWEQNIGPLPRRAR